MDKYSKMMACGNCGNMISQSTKVCPYCGKSYAKPFYKRGWFIFLVILVLLISFFSIRSRIRKERALKFDWDELELCDMLPDPGSRRAEIDVDTGNQLSITVMDISRSQYKKYADKCKELGFTVEAVENTYFYEAYNADGYKLHLGYSDDEEEDEEDQLYISLKAPMKMDPLHWPDNELTRRIPAPNSDVGIIQTDTSTTFSATVGDMPMEAFTEYVDDCKEMGFNVDYHKSDDSFNADDAEGYRVYVSYTGNSHVDITIRAPEKPAEEPSVPIDTDPPEGSGEAPDTPQEPEEPDGTDTPSDAPAPLVDGMRPEFKEAMDSYEAFYNSYIEFMKKYKANPTDLSLLSEYAEILEDAEEMDEKFNAWNNDDMNDAELKYYTEVNLRVMQKLLQVM